jgi:lysophospholipase L1-like esterase
VSSRTYLSAVALAFGASACGGGGTPPTGPTGPMIPETPQLVLTCPGSMAVNTEVTPYVVTYAQPVASGGSAPLQTTCTINPGAIVGPGSSDVVCTATDSAQRRAQCTFSITVNVVRRLKGTKFLAFGDSITEGEVSQPWPNVHDVDPLNNYPVVLQDLLRQRYAFQKDSIVVLNAGVHGINATADEARFISTTIDSRADAVLLMQGVNDVNEGIDPVVIAESLKRSVRRALSGGVKAVFVSTLLPQVRPGFRAYNPSGVEALNEEIRYAIPSVGGIVVDSYAAFRPLQDLLIGIDGLHPTVDGYKKLAEVWADAIKLHFEEPEPTSSPASMFAVLPRNRRLSPLPTTPRRGSKVLLTAAAVQPGAPRPRQTR